MQGEVGVYAPRMEGEGYDRVHLGLPGLQLTLAQSLATRTTTPLIAVLVHGGPLDVAWLQESPRFGAILTAWYPGQVWMCSVVHTCIHARTQRGSQRERERERLLGL